MRGRLDGGDKLAIRKEDKERTCQLRACGPVECEQQDHQLC
jgi:hypothetical protein